MMMIPHFHYWFAYLLTELVAGAEAAEDDEPSLLERIACAADGPFPVELVLTLGFPSWRFAFEVWLAPFLKRLLAAAADVSFASKGFDGAEPVSLYSMNLV